MMKVLIGNMFESSSKSLVNTVNCVGVMGKGVAQEFKKRFPAMFKDYEQRCQFGKVEPGVPYLYSDMLGASIINFPTKKHWRSPSRLEDVIKGLDIFTEMYKEWGIESIAFPPLGCGNGGLEWTGVGPIMYQKLIQLDIDIEIYAPYGTPKQQLSIDFLTQEKNIDAFVKGKKSKKLNPSWIALLEVLDELGRQPYANPVGRTIFQKICYVLTEQGVDTGFKFSQGSYGPFSQEVQEALSVFANMNLIQEKQLGRMTALIVSKELEEITKKYQTELNPLRKKVSKTIDLFSRIKNTEQAEEVTTVLFAARQLKKQKSAGEVSEQDLYDFIVKWKKAWVEPEKQKAVASAIRNLEMLGWVKLKYSDSLPF